MTRKEFVQRLVLNEICDDYENLEMINKWIAGNSARIGLTIEESEVIEGLGGLIQSGLAKAYRLTPTARKPRALLRMPPLSQIKHYYFIATPKGMDLQVSDRTWCPFDDDDEVRKDWRAPSE
jgi:hypothetical protein